MLIVAIRALDQSFVHPMMKRLTEFGLDVQMAGIAKPRLAADQQELRLLGVVGGVAIRAGHAIRVMRRALEIAVLLAVLVAGQAAIGNLLGRSSLEHKYLGLVAAALDVRLSRAVARFAPLVFRTTPRIQCGFPVRRLFERVVDIFVADLASLRAHIARGRIL